MNELITVKEFAAREGVTVQAVYQRLNTSLKPFSRKIKGVKYINYADYKASLNAPIMNDSSPDVERDYNTTLDDKAAVKAQETAENSGIQDNSSNDNSAPVQGLNSADTTILAALMEQLRIKDAQIERLQAQISELTEALKAEQENTQQAHAALMNEQSVSQQAQQLHAATITAAIEAPKKKRRNFFRRSNQDNDDI